jgi:plasmid replication initiation protein
MQTELFEVNTTETLGVTPRFVLQHNAISRSAHNFSATAKKLTAMAMAMLPADLSTLSAAFTFTEFCKAIGYTKSGESFALFKNAVKECMESVIEVEGPKNKKGKTPWVMYHWFQLAEFNPDNGVCTMTFDKKLAEFLKELKRLYSKINLSDFGRLQSRYALRIYELAISYASLQGKDGNEADTWYLERTLEELRKIFGIEPGEYKENREFRRKVIEGPIREINKAGIGVEITTESIKKGRNLSGLRFDCKKVSRTARPRRGRAKDQPQPELSDLKPSNAETRTEKENEHLKELYPDEFADLYAEALKSLKPIGGGIGESFRLSAAEARALETLRDRHGIVK